MASRTERKSELLMLINKIEEESASVGDESDTNSMPTTPKLQPDTQDKEIEQQPNWIWYSA